MRIIKLASEYYQAEYEVTHTVFEFPDDYDVNEVVKTCLPERGDDEGVRNLVLDWLNSGPAGMNCPSGSVLAVERVYLVYTEHNDAEVTVATAKEVKRTAYDKGTAEPFRVGGKGKPAKPKKGKKRP